MRYSLALVLGALALSACTDQIDRSPTSPFSPQFSFTTLGAPARAAFEETIRGGIRCLIVDGTQETRKINDFDGIVKKADLGERQTVTDWVNNFVKWANDYGTNKKTEAPSKDPGACGGRSLTYAQAAQELYDLLYWYSGQYLKIVGGVQTVPNVDAGQVWCFPGAACTLDGEKAFIRAPGNAFTFPVILGFRPLVGALPADFNTVGTPVPPYYEFFTIPEGVTARAGWGRYVCVSWADHHNGDNQLYKLTNGELEVMPGLGPVDIICPQPSPESTNSLLRHLNRFASRMTTPVRPRVLHAAGHRSIGGPSTTASPHAVVRAASVSSVSCDNVTGWGDANAQDANGQSWDITSNPYPTFTSFVSLTVYLRMNAIPSTLTVSAEAQRFTNEAGTTGHKNLGLATSVTRDATYVGLATNEYKVTFTWPAQSVKPSGRVDVNITGLNSLSVEYGVTGAGATGCVLKELVGSQSPVAGSIAGHPQGS